MFQHGNKAPERKRNLSAVEIESYLKKSKTYLGIIYVSSFKSLTVKANCFSFIVYCTNHWFVIYCCDKSIEIFDSLGFLDTKGCVPNNLLLFIHSHIGTKNFKASHTVQPPDSQLCGIYSLYYILMRDKGYTFEQIMDTFSKDLKENDLLMQRFINKF